MPSLAENFYGMVRIVDIENHVPGNDSVGALNQATPLLTFSNIKVVHYPDCQQLIIWLPDSGRLYATITIHDAVSSALIWEKKVEDILSGSIQLLLDTLTLPVGSFILVIHKHDSTQHIIRLKKFAEGENPSAADRPPNSSDAHATPITYKDGMGNTIPDEDLLLRKKHLEKMEKLFGRHVLIEGTIRAGAVKYIEGSRSISFYSEMGGGNCLFYIDIPTSANWEKQTGFTLAERNEILQFIAEETLRKQTSSSNAYFVIDERGISFMTA